jgi:hypothetical protein
MAESAFHDAYHPCLVAVWQYRVAVRKELGWGEWDGRERCPVCTT